MSIPTFPLPAVAATLVLLPALGVAQSPCPSGPCPDTVPGVIEGVVYDSTTATPLDGARVAVMGTAVDAVTDGEGRFRMEAVPPGRHEVTFWHPRLQELGVGPPSALADVSSHGATRLHLAVPSRATLYALWCALEPEGQGDRVLTGLVRDSVTGVPLPGAVIVLRELQGSWRDEETETEVRTGSGGEYRFCDVSSSQRVSVQAAYGERSGSPRMLDAAEGITVQDLLVSVSQPGMIQGEVVEWGTDEPVPGAEVVLAGSTGRAVSGSGGGFTILDVPPGRHLLTTRHLGFMERTDSVTVLGDEGVGVRIRLSREAIPLGPLEVVVRARRGAFDRETMGTRYDGLTRAEIDAVLPRVNTMSQLLRSAKIPGIRIRDVFILDRGFQLPALCIETMRRAAQHAGDCNMVAVYVDDMRIVAPEFLLRDLDPQTVDRVQLLSPLEAGARYGNEGRNAVLLIYTRSYQD